MQFKYFFATLLLVPFAALSAAQIKNGTVTEASVALLDDPAVRKELKLTKAQDDYVKREFKRVNDAAQAVFASRPKNETEAKAAQQKVRSLQLGLVKNLTSKLQAPQLKRLRELGLQYFGPFAMLSPEITKELKLSTAQVNKLKAAQKELMDRTRMLQQTRQNEVKKIPQPKDKNDQKAVKAYFEKVQATLAKYGSSDRKLIQGYKIAAEGQALNALSATQKSQWKAMQGKKFTPPKGT
jgi:hypothetical protein